MKGPVPLTRHMEGPVKVPRGVQEPQGHGPVTGFPWSLRISLRINEVFVKPRRQLIELSVTEPGESHFLTNLSLNLFRNKFKFFRKLNHIIFSSFRFSHGWVLNLIDD